MVLSYSRAISALFTLDQTLESFLRGHVEAFHHAFGGVARTLVYDNLRRAVLERQGSAIRFHPRPSAARSRRQVEAFHHAFGGVARTLVYDNLRRAVLERQGSAIRFHPRPSAARARR